MQDFLNMTRRTSLGKTSVKKLRAEGFVPAVVYSKDSPATPVQLDEESLEKYFESGGRIADLQLEGEKLKAVVKEVQHDEIDDRILHVDFQLVSTTEKIVLPVAVILKGELQLPPDEGILEQVITEVEVECLPGDAPEEFTVDVSEMKVGDTIHVENLELPSGVVMITPGDETIALVSRPALEEEVEEPVEGEEEMLEPELIGEKKEEEPEEGEES